MGSKRRRQDTSPLPESFRKATWLLFGRQGVLLLSIVVLLIHEGGEAPFTEVFRPAYIFLIGASILNLAFMTLIRLFRRMAWFTAGQIVLDCFLISSLSYLTGGLNSNFTPLYFAAILSASVLLSSRSGILIASVCTVQLSSVSLAYFFSYHYGFALPCVAPQWGIRVEREIAFIFAFLLAHTGAFYAVALLSGRLSAGARHMRIMTDEILQNMGGGVIAMGSDRMVAYINSAARSLLGLTAGPREPMIPLSELLKEAQLRPVAEALGSFSEGSRDVEILREGSDLALPLQVTTSLLRDDRGRRRGLIAIIEDLSLRREIEETRRSIERMEAISEVSASIPHEVRNPLASIRGAIQEVVETEELGSQSGELLNMALSETDRLDKIVTQFLHFARRSRLERKRIDLKRLLDDVTALLKSRNTNPAIEIGLDVRGALECMGDRDQLHQVFLNLGVNGLDAVGDRGGAMRIEAYPEERMVPGISVRFIDTGGGVEDDSRHRVFEPFWSTKHNGTGLGLSLARRVVRDHGGSIDVSNNDDGGATFTVWLPVGTDVPDGGPSQD